MRSAKTPGATAAMPFPLRYSHPEQSASQLPVRTSTLVAKVRQNAQLPHPPTSTESHPAGTQVLSDPPTEPGV